MRRRTLAPIFSAALATLGTTSVVSAIAWNSNMPTYSATSTNGLTDQPTLFVDENVITNNNNSTRGTATYLGNGWILTAQHVVQNGSNYAQICAPTQMVYNVGGTNYTGDYISTVAAPGGSDIALVHLSGFTTGNIAALPGVAKSQIYTGSSESNTLVQIGGYGYFGPLGSSSLSTSATFHHAFNIASASGGFVNISANASSRLVTDGYVMGIAESGDSGSAMWMDTGADSDTNLNDYDLIGVTDTSNGFAFGDTNQYARVSDYSGWILSNVYATAVTWNASGSGTTAIDGGGTWDTTSGSTVWLSGTSDVAFSNNSAVTIGNAHGAAGTITLGSAVTVNGLWFNAASSGNYTITANTLTLAEPQIVTNASATIASVIAGSVGLSKNGSATLFLTGSNTYTAGTTLDTGVLNIQSDSNLGALPSSPANNILFQGNSTLQAATSLTVNANRKIVVNGGVTAFFDSHGNTLTVAGVISGTGNIGKVGTGTLYLTGSNTFTGIVNVGNSGVSGGNVDGALRITSPAEILDASEVSLSDNNTAYATFQLDGSGGNVSLPSSVTFSINGNNAGPAATAANIIENIAGLNSISGVVTYNVGGTGYGIRSDAGTLTFSGGFTYSGSSAKTFFLDGPGNGAFTGVVTGTAGMNLTGAGTWTFLNANTNTGAFTIAAGTISTNLLTPEGAGSTGSTPSGIGQSNDAAANLVLTGGMLQYTGANASTDRLFTIGPAGGTIDGSGAGGLTFTNTAAAVSSDAATHTSSTTVNSNSVTITAGGLTDLAIGMAVHGTGISSGTTITAVNFDAGTITLSAVATATGTPTLSFGALNRTLTLTGSSTLTNTLDPVLVNSSGGGVLSLNKTGSTTWSLAGNEIYTGSTAVTSGTLNVSGSLASPTVTVAASSTLNVSGSLNSSTALTAAGAANFSANTGGGFLTRTFSSLTVASTGQITVAKPSASSSRTVLVTSALSNSGLIDLSANDAVIHNGDPVGITSEIAAAYNSGPWNGISGITSSAAAAVSNTALGVELNSNGTSALVSTFDNQPVTSTDVLIKYTYFGDANLDGVVDGNDYTLIDNGFNNELTGWSNGDFNYDGTINGDDYTLIDNSFNTQGASLAAIPTEMVAAATAQVAAVPEPASVGILALSAAALFSRRSRRRHEPLNTG